MHTRPGRPVKLAALLVGLALLGGVRACTRISQVLPNGDVQTGRTMDWPQNPRTSVYVVPRGMRKHGLAGAGSMEWTSRHASIVAPMYDLGTVDGLNEQGLSGSLLFFAGAEFGDAAARGRPLMSFGLTLQHVLDSYSTVAEAVTALRDEPYTAVPMTFPSGNNAPGHMHLFDLSGDAAVLEWINGSLVIHHSPNHTVLTNAPPFPDQLAVAAYWDLMGGDALPGTTRSSDRFVRATYYAREATKSNNTHVSLVSLRSVLRACSAPLGVVKPDAPVESSTEWYNFMDQTKRRFYHERSMNYGPVYLDLAAFDTSAGAPVRWLEAWNMSAMVKRVGDAADLTVALAAEPNADARLPPALAVRSDGACDEVMACLKAWQGGSGGGGAPAPAPAPAQASRRMQL